MQAIYLWKSGWYGLPENKFSESGEAVSFKFFLSIMNRRSRPTEFPMIIWIFHMEKN